MTFLSYESQEKIKNKNTETIFTNDFLFNDYNPSSFPRIRRVGSKRQKITDS